MRIVGFGTNAVTLELDPGDCLALAEACRQTVRNDAATDTDRTDLLEATLTLAAMAAATWDGTTGSQRSTVGQLREAWLRPDPPLSPRPPREAGE